MPLAVGMHDSRTHLLEEGRHGGLHMRPSDLSLQGRVCDSFLGAVVEGDDRLWKETGKKTTSWNKSAWDKVE